MTETEVVDGEIVQEKSLATWTPKFVITVDEAVARHDERIDYMKRVLKEGTHYGVIPGTGTKPALLKPGAEALMADMGLRPDMLDEHPPVLDFDGRDHNLEPFIHYQRKANLYRLHPVTGERVWVGSGSGSCNSWEDKYRWRTSVRSCPICGKAAIIKGKPEYAPKDKTRLIGKGTDAHYALQAGYEQGGWVCFKKKDGCGATFADADSRIAGQVVGRVPNDRIADLANTILKMADKRAIVAAVLNTTGVSDLFTQDVEDANEKDDDEKARAEATQQKTQEFPMPQADVDAIKARYKELAGTPEGKKIVSGKWAAFMKEKAGDKWSALWAHAELVDEARSILGMTSEDAFDPAKVPA